MRPLARLSRCSGVARNSVRFFFCCACEGQGKAWSRSGHETIFYLNVNDVSLGLILSNFVAINVRKMATGF